MQCKILGLLLKGLVNAACIYFNRFYSVLGMGGRFNILTPLVKGLY
jgi:hypothetical protein